MGEHDPVPVVRAAVDALNDGDTDRYLAGFHPSCPRWIAGIAEPLTLDEVADNLRQLWGAFDPVRLEEEALFGSDELVCARWRLVGSHVADYLGIPPSRRDVAVKSCEVYEVRHGKIATVWTYQDPVELFRQIGAA